MKTIIETKSMFSRYESLVVLLDNEAKANWRPVFVERHIDKLSGKTEYWIILQRDKVSENDPI